MKKYFIISIFCLMFVLSSCGDANYSKYESSNYSTSSSNAVELVKNKLYYLSHKRGEADFPPKLELFIENHPEFEVIGIEQDIKEGKNKSRIDGYFVLVTLKDVK